MQTLFKLLLVVVCLYSMPLMAQENYKKTYDDPEDVIKGHIALEYYGVDVGFSNVTGAMIFIAGLNGAYTITPNVVAEASIRMPILRFEKQGAAFIFDGGVNFAISSSITDKNVRVVLAYKEEDIGGGYEQRSVKYVNVFGTVKKSLMLRGGLYLKNTSFEYKEGNADYGVTNLFHKGVYLGIGKQRQYFFQLERDVNGRKTQFGAGSIFRPYFDVLILPTSVVVQQETFGLGVGATKELSGFIGGRAGFRWYRNPFTRKQNYDHRIPFFGNSVVTLEAGMRPLDGFFINGGISFIMYKL